MERIHGVMRHSRRPWNAQYVWKCPRIPCLQNVVTSSATIAWWRPSTTNVVFPARSVRNLLHQGACSLCQNGATWSALWMPCIRPTSRTHPHSCPGMPLSSPYLLLPHLANLPRKVYEKRRWGYWRSLRLRSVRCLSHLRWWPWKPSAWQPYCWGPQDRGAGGNVPWNRLHSQLTSCGCSR